MVSEVSAVATDAHTVASILLEEAATTVVGVPGRSIGKALSIAMVAGVASGQGAEVGKVQRLLKACTMSQDPTVRACRKEYLLNRGHSGPNCSQTEPLEALVSHWRHWSASGGTGERREALVSLVRHWSASGGIGQPREALVSLGRH